MLERSIIMSFRELDRLEVIQRVVCKELTQREAALALGLSIRQIKRLVARLRCEGVIGLVSRRRGKPANNAFSLAFRQSVLALVREHYADFGPTLTCEKLEAFHQYQLSTETLRQWMIAEGLWIPKQQRKAGIHQGRPRRER